MVRGSTNAKIYRKASASSLAKPGGKEMNEQVATMLCSIPP